MRLSDTKIGILYPWPGLPSMDRGVARRVVPLIWLLSKHVRTIEVLSPGIACPLREGNVVFTYHRQPWEEKVFVDLAFRLFEGITHHACRGRVPVEQRRQWWHYLQPRLSLSLRRAIRKLAGASDVLFAEYPFWVRLIPTGRPVVLTHHDVLSDRVLSPWLRARVLGEELSACCRANSLVCCNETDAGFFGLRGLQPVRIPHAMNLHDESRTAPQTSVAGRLSKIVTKRAQGALICFFIGSSHQPNREAVEEISAMARRFGEDSRFVFVVAGSCCASSEPAANEIHLGPVSESELDGLYSLCDIVLAPLRNGTGASLKTLEAFARKKPLVTTEVGARGYPIVSGRDAAVVGEPAAFDDVLRYLADDPAERTRLAAGGWQFVQSYDSSVVYADYLPLVERLLSDRINP